MAGHSKWAQIKHKKAATDAKRGKQFTKLARAITVAAREGGGDPDGNATLATAIQKARDYSMPKDNIQRAIDRGTGEGGAAGEIERAVYEGYGPGGAAILVEALTDNRNRTGADVRHAFDKHGGSLGEPGSVAWIFENRGVVLVDADRYSEDDLMPAIDAGAEDVSEDGDLLKVVSAPANLSAVRAALEPAGVEIESSELTMEPRSIVEVGEGDARPPDAPDGGPRRAGRRRRGARQLRHPGRGARAGRRVAIGYDRAPRGWRGRGNPDHRRENPLDEVRRQASRTLAAGGRSRSRCCAHPGSRPRSPSCFSSGPINLPIPNNAPTGVFSAIGVGKKGTVKDVDVAVRISHPNVSQLNLYLFKGEKYVALARNVGGSGNDFGSGTADCAGTFTVFDGAAPTFIQTGAAPFNGAYRPAESLGLFNGDGSKGTWRLFAYDQAGGTSGLVNCWALGLDYKKKKKK